MSETKTNSSSNSTSNTSKPTNQSNASVIPSEVKIANSSSGKTKAIKNDDKIANKVDSKQKKEKEGIKIPFFSKPEDNDNMTTAVGVATQSVADK